jgi:tRNA threonylcarbamoyladenosine dehydratase
MNDKRLMRTKALLGENGVKNLQNATVMVFGLGAVGGYALEGLARAGIGHLILVDFDVFDESNINRQILALSSTVGKKKTETAKQRVLEINPECNVDVEDTFVTDENISILLNRKIDYAVDAIDILRSKCSLMYELYKRQIPFVSSMGAALKTDASCIKTAKLSQTVNCPMARCIRQNLKKRGADLSKIDCVFSAEQCNLPEGAISKNPQGGKNILGSLPTITAIFGLTIANKIIGDIAKGR